MKTVTRIEMANDNDIYDVKFGALLEIKPDGEGFTIYEDGEEINYYHTKQQAEEAITESVVDSQLIVTGYGKHSGRKFWQLPTKIQESVLSMAKAN